MGQTPAIEAEGLVKNFGKTKALAGLDLTVPAGTVYGLLGPNGAGKTTAVRVFATLLRPDGGRARVLGRDVADEAAEVRRQIGLTGQYAALDEYLTGRANPEEIVYSADFTRRGYLTGLPLLAVGSVRIER